MPQVQKTGKYIIELDPKATPAEVIAFLEKTMQESIVIGYQRIDD